MILLVLGLIMWTLVHMIPVALPNVRGQCIRSFGESPYKGGFTLLILGSVALMVFGWRSIDETVILYNIYDYAIVPSLILLLIAMIFMASSIVKNNLGNAVRHPQLVGFSLWAICHLLINGDLRATILFGGLLIWSVTTIFLLNRRDGAQEKQKFILPHKTVTAGAIGMVLFIAFVWGHQYIAGVNLMGQNAT